MRPAVQLVAVLATIGHSDGRRRAAPAPGGAPAAGAPPDEAALRRRLQAAPTDENGAIMPLVGLLHQQQRLAEAEAVLEDAVAQVPRSSRLLVGLGFLQMQDDDRVGLAMRHLRAALELSPTDRFATNNMCDATLRSGADAIAVCRDAVRVGPEMGHNHFLLGRALVSAYHWDEAAASFETAIKIDDTGSNPNAAEVYREKAGMLESRGRLKEAEHAAQRAVAINPANLGAVMALGVQHKKLGKWDEAIADFGRATGLGPSVEQDKMIVNHLGQTLTWAGRDGEAQQLYKRTVEAKGHWLDPRQRPYPNFLRHLPSKPWYANPSATARETADNVARPAELSSTEPLSTAIALLERQESSAAVAAEFHQWEAAHPNGWLPQPEVLHDDKVCLDGREGCYWKVWHVAGKAPLGPASPCDETKWPSVCGLLSAISSTGLNVRTAQFSELGPGLHIRPHCGATNDRLVLHLGVDVKDGPADHSDHSGLEMVVGGEVGSWAAGRVTAFDDSFEHEVYHRGQHRRVVLLLHIDHPNLSAYRAQQHQQRQRGAPSAAGDVEEIVLRDDDEEEDDEDDEAAAGLGLAGWLRTVRPALPDAAVLGYAAALSQSQCCDRVEKLLRASRAQLIDAGVKIGHARAILHTANLVGSH
jgi:tetratricopeptide (TPR) repeat protein